MEMPPPSSSWQHMFADHLLPILCDFPQEVKEAIEANANHYFQQFSDKFLNEFFHLYFV